MSQDFLHASLLREFGIEHGFGVRGSEATPPEGLLHAHQVHGARVLTVPPLSLRPEGDALLTTRDGVAVGVFTADCVPVLVSLEGGEGVLAVHAGWRGSALAVVEVAVQTLIKTIRCRPDDLVAALGPCIGACCYEVDAPVRSAIADDGVFSASGRVGRYQLDLRELNRRQLLRAGLRPERIQLVGGCTSCDPTRYYSYRRDGSQGRLLHYVRCPGSPDSG
ncbi:MAG: peptidoglycan editing factor PgeF [Myxococcota bacterium]